MNVYEDLTKQTREAEQKLEALLRLPLGTIARIAKESNIPFKKAIQLINSRISRHRAIIKQLNKKRAEFEKEFFKKKGSAIEDQ